MVNKKKVAYTALLLDLPSESVGEKTLPISFNVIAF